MNLEDLGNIGDFVGALAVIISLVYLAAQIRQNTKVVRSTSSREAARNFGETIAWLGVSPETAEVFHRGIFDPSTLTEPEKTHFTLMMTHIFMNAESGYWDQKDNILTPDSWDRMQQTIRFYFSMPGGRWGWRRHKPFVGAEFKKYVEIEFSDELAIGK